MRMMSTGHSVPRGEIKAEIASDGVLVDDPTSQRVVGENDRRRMS